ncbi:MAG: hypothetical protein WD716_04425 [Fimbriimonadaceae bacterium]
MRKFDSPGLEPPVVELTSEREAHIQLRHPDLLPGHMHELQETVRAPDLIVANAHRPNKRAMARWFGSLKGGKFVIVQVVTDEGPSNRHWIVTAYLDSVPPT